jgi:hypothetical protein
VRIFGGGSLLAGDGSGVPGLAKKPKQISAANIQADSSLNQTDNHWSSRANRAK